MADAIIVDANISPSLHEASLEPFRAVLAPEKGATHTATAFAAAAGALRSLYSGLSDITAAELTTRQQFGNGIIMPGSNMKQQIPNERAVELAALMGVKFSSVARTVDAALGVVAETEKKLQVSIDAALTNTKRDAVAAAEAQDIRGYSTNLPDNKRMNWVHSCIDANDVAVIQALHASPWAAGLSRDQAATLKDLAARKLTPVAVDQLEAITKVAAHLRTAAEIFTKEYAGLVPVINTNPHAAALKRLKGEG